MEGTYTESGCRIGILDLDNLLHGYRGTTCRYVFTVERCFLGNKHMYGIAQGLSSFTATVP